ncbi:putative glutamate carboxypeptidase 2 [Apostasia shenzhenica]|uniref:Putative glutamate carboxypeptidase 2 n=1 Tax=Apostasia shenzhenica TaxID=1088818 RepID=A0A2I0BE37_9ASPA|nr:putative glutamate carboxypeptidase 2 [Apostasia shenzhenica]
MMPSSASPNFSRSSRRRRLLLLFPLLLLLLILLLLSLLRSPESIPISSNSTPSVGVAADAGFFFLSLSKSANSSISSHLRAITLNTHLAGTPSAATAAAYVRSQLERAGLETLTREYSPFLSYPAAASLSLLRSDGALIKPLSLAEPADPAVRVVPPYHAYSASGATVGPAVYVNLGRDEDYLTLHRLGVDVRGCVAVVRRGGGPRGAVVETAAARGAKAVLMYGKTTGGGVERGTVLLGGPGDPLTPGWAAIAGGERFRVEDGEVTRRFPRIPSMPVSAATAGEILVSLGGLPAPPEWKAESPALVGVGGGLTLLNFTYMEDGKLAAIHNIISIIEGSEEPDRYVILGNHRDAWTYGAVDPNSGTAVLLDIASRYGTLLRSGWRPRRTIIICSWDAEEFGMIGSTEWVEQNLGNLSPKAVAYLNVDSAVQGPGFFASASPQLDKLLIEIMKQVKDPDSEGMTVYQTWVAKNGGISIERLSRADSDFTAFLHHAGVPATDIYFGEVSEIWGLLGLRLANDQLLPFDYLSYASQLQEHETALGKLVDGMEFVLPVSASIQEFAAAAKEVQQESMLYLYRFTIPLLIISLPHVKSEKNTQELKGRGIAELPALRLRALNDRLMLTERAFLEAEGLRGRPWFKHLIYSPPKDSASKLSFFPGIADAISESNDSAAEAHANIQHEIWRVARAIQRATDVLCGKLT